MNFNEKLIELRKSKGLSQDELGNALGVSRQTISAIYEDVNTGKSTINKVENIYAYRSCRDYTFYAVLRIVFKHKKLKTSDINGVVPRHLECVALLEKKS
nr:helix-turn-helix domain-containing protein [uncultured Stomatobaculum sp.]